MVADAASARIKYWISQQMIQVYKHCEKQKQIYLKPFISIEDKGDNTGKCKVQEVMKYCLHFTYFNFRSFALTATITVLKLISTAPIAGLKVK